MDTFIQTTIVGLGAGALDALLALGIVLIYRTTGVLNFAQAAIGSFSCYVIYSVALDRPLWLAIGAGVATGAGLGIGTYRVVSGIQARQYALTAAVATLAVGILIQQAIRIGWGTTAGAFPMPLGFDSVDVASVSISHLTIAGVAVAGTLAISVGAFLRWTRTGTMVRALADNPSSAALCGANVSLLLSGIWASAGALAAVAGFFIAPFGFFPSFLDPYFVAALIAAVLGGLRSLTGTFFGALLLEVAYNLFQTYAQQFGPYVQTFLILVLIVVLVLAPPRWLSQVRERLV